MGGGGTVPPSEGQSRGQGTQQHPHTNTPPELHDSLWHDVEHHARYSLTRIHSICSVGGGDRHNSGQGTQQHHTRTDLLSSMMVSGVMLSTRHAHRALSVTWQPCGKGCVRERGACVLMLMLISGPGSERGDEVYRGERVRTRKTGVCVHVDVDIGAR